MAGVIELAESDREFAWTAQRFMAIVEGGMFADSRRIELIEGHIREEMPQGEVHYGVYSALGLAFQSMGGVRKGIRTGSTVFPGDRDVYDPEYLVVTPKTPLRKWPRKDPVVLAIEIGFTSLSKDLGPKRRGYARAGIPHYWVFDALHRRLHAFSWPEGESYQTERVLTAAECISIPGVGAQLDLAEIFAESEP